MGKTKTKSVKWQWQGDDKEWVDYAQRVCDKLEEARESKSKVRVDSQRFVDLKTMLQVRSLLSYIEHSTNVFAPTHLQNQKCRYDQSGRKRAVRRVEEDSDAEDNEAEKIFEGNIFFLLGDTFSCSREKLISAIGKKYKTTLSIVLKRS